MRPTTAPRAFLSTGLFYTGREFPAKGKGVWTQSWRHGRVVEGVLPTRFPGFLNHKI